MLGESKKLSVSFSGDVSQTMDIPRFCLRKFFIKKGGHRARSGQ